MAIGLNSSSRSRTEKQTKLIEDNIKLTMFFTNKYYSNSDKNYLKVLKIDYEDLLSVANLGLIKAAISFDESKGFKFATFASTCIFREYGMLLKKNKNTIQTFSIDYKIKSS